MGPEAVARKAVYRANNRGEHTGELVTDLPPAKEACGVISWTRVRFSGLSLVSHGFLPSFILPDLPHVRSAQFQVLEEELRREVPAGRGSLPTKKCVTFFVLSCGLSALICQLRCWPRSFLLLLIIPWGS